MGFTLWSGHRMWILIALSLIYLSSTSMVVFTAAQQVAAQINSSYSSTNLTVNEGANAILACSVIGDPRPAVTWSHDQHSSRKDIDCPIKQFIPAGGCITDDIVILRNITRECSGTYHCETYNDIGPHVIHDIYLSVHFMPGITVPSEKVSQVTGRDAILECSISSVPLSAMSWRRFGEKIETSEKYQILNYADNDFMITIILKVIGLQETDAGEYKCAATNYLGKTTKEVQLSVVLPVTISIPVKLVNGIHKKEAALECHISGSPINSVYWTGPDGKNLTRSDKYAVSMYDEGGSDITMVLVISNLDHNDKGKYYCVAINDVQESTGAVTLHVKLDLPFCEQLSSDTPMCKTMPYNTTKFPNHLGHTTAGEAYEELSNFWPLVKSKCSFQLRPLLCSVYFPKCTAYGDSLLPCRSLCYRGKRGCQDVIAAFNMEWPERLDCRNLPEQNCYNTNENTVPKATTTTAPTPCEPITAITPMCLIDINYKTTKFPNILGHETALEAHAEMAQYWPLLEIGCASEIRQLLCSLYVPKCTNDGMDWLPCRQLCKKTKSGCSSLMKQYNFQWPNNLDCNTLSDDNCVSMEQPEDMCQDITVDVCHTLPYSATKFPNYVGDNTQQEAAAHIQQFKPIIEMDCAPEFETLICSTYLPQCTNTGQILKPCKELCEKAKAGCKLFAYQYGFSWPEALACDNLPTDSDCFNMHFPTTKPKIECEEIMEPLCYNLPYNATGFPNNLNHLNQIDAAIELQQFLPLLQVECAPELHVFLCSLYIPACEDSGEIIKPCKDLCEKSRAGCEPLMNKFGYEWPDLLHCDWLPEGDGCISAQDENMCEKISMEFCSDMPYNATTYPNFLSHTSQKAAEEELLKFLPLIAANCAPELQTFLCSMYVPQCTATGHIILPCKSLCQKSRAACQSTMNSIGFKWPKELNCKDLPSDDSCFNYAASDAEKCENIHISLCDNLPYNLTKFPNMLSNQNQDEAQLDLQRFLPFINSECAPELRHFLCSVYVPECSTKGNIRRPCQDLCVKSRSGCEHLMNRIGMKWPESLSCDLLPDNGDCYDVTNSDDKVSVVDVTMCVDISIKMCANLPYNTTKFPNILSHETQEEAQVKMLKYSQVINTGCALELEHFLCSVHFPECKRPSQTIKPCKELCQKSRVGCENIMNEQGIEWPTELNCDELTDNNCSSVIQKVAMEDNCEDLIIKICETLPYNTTRFPNVFSHETQEEARVEFLKYSKVIDTGCALELEPFLCSAYFPECSSSGHQVKPCKELCEKSRDRCENIMNQLDIHWPASLLCEDLADDNCSSVIHKATNTEKCEDLKSKVCKGLPYNTTLFPNDLSHETQDEAEVVFINYAPVIDTGCALELEPFLCSVFFPECTLRSKSNKPCMELCQKSRDLCENNMNELGLEWPIALQCENLPNDNCSNVFQTVVLPEETCESITTPMCQGLLYNQTKFPSFLGHTTQQEAGLAILQFAPLLNINCAADLQSFLCSMFIPECSSGGTIIKPCRELCHTSRSGCETFMNRIGMEWPQQLSCDQLPEDGACFNARKADVNKCEPVTVAACTDMQYNMTIFPNFLSHKTQAEAEVEFDTLLPLIQAACSPALKPFLCAMYAPKCSMPDQAMKPCRSLCTQAKKDCAILTDQLGFSWRDTLSCDVLPQGGDCLNVTFPDVDRCEPVTVSACTDMQYNMTIFPNFLSHKTQAEAEVEFDTLLPLIQAACSPALKPFLCAMYAPKCSLPDRTMKPCRSLCTKAKKDCAILMDQLGFSWRDTLSCDVLPQGGDCLNVTFPDEPKCEDINIPMCQALPYNETNFPNLLHHKSQEEAEADLNKFLQVVESNCSPELIPFLCSMYVPSCSLSGNFTKPCRELCDKASDGCKVVTEALGLTWPDQLTCDDLPEKNSCFDIEIHEPPPAQLCENIKVRKCQAMGYNRTLFPNEISQTQDDAYSKLSTFIPLSYFGCSKTLMPFVCSLYVPPCSDSTGTYTKPCKSLCLAAKEECEPIMHKLGIKWKDALSCDNFQDDDGCFSYGVKKRVSASSCGIDGCLSKGTNKKCDADCDTFECEFDNKECSFGIVPLKTCKAQQNGVPCDKLFHNGECDSECNTERCLYDGFDCQGKPRECSPLYKSYCKTHFGDRECDLGCSPAYCGFDGGDCILTPLFLRGSLILTLDMDPLQIQSRSSDILMELALVTHTVIFIEKDDAGNNKIEPVTLNKTINVNGVADSDFNTGSKLYLKVDFGSCIEEFSASECFRSITTLAHYLSMAIRVGIVNSTTLPILNIDYENT